MPMWGFRATKAPQWQSLLRTTSILGPVSPTTIMAYSTTETECVVTRARVGWSNLAVAIQSVSGCEDEESRLSISEMRKGHELCGLVFSATRRLRYDKVQSMLVTKTPVPPGTQMNDQTVTGNWPDPWWDWLLAGAQAALPELLQGNYLTAALSGIGAGLTSFLEERERRRTAQHHDLAHDTAAAYEGSALEGAEEGNVPQS
ncbi:hypothetical protein Y032_0300g1802 [Ancylostoma ceylanicum]|uniref:Uncharacterized protein n=1 Tax=Ancylostoma ceylanicum TaxID=53326 RepID=A0A016S3U9_9BILA|nr:hypothetical protein Y032_0300g1802 [Ancylostoma ceylanicum]